MNLSNALDRLLLNENTSSSFYGFGFPNSNNICYINTVINGLRAVSKFEQLILSDNLEQFFNRYHVLFNFSILFSLSCQNLDSVLFWHIIEY
jgi:ubiquitin C-terminal hydrolase